jgi:2-furoyl-CoA dehydrogenase large subunit
MGDGSSMLTPAAVANAVADALGRDDIVLPLTLQRVWSLANGGPARVARATAPAGAPDRAARRALTGEGEVELSAPPAEIWRRLTDPQELAAIVPGCRDLVQDGPDRYRADVTIGVAGIRGRYTAVIELREPRAPHALRLIGRASGALGHGEGEGDVTLSPTPQGGTTLRYRYAADVGGKVAAVGQRMLGAVTRVLIAEFFRALERGVAPHPRFSLTRWLASLLRRRAQR